MSTAAGSTVPGMSETTGKYYLGVVAWVRATPGADDRVREALTGFVAPTLQEEGCID